MSWLSEGLAYGATGLGVAGLAAAPFTFGGSVPLAMGGAALLTAGASLLAANEQAKAAAKAGKISQEVADQQIAANERALRDQLGYNEQTIAQLKETLRPALEGGELARERLLSSLGLAGDPATAGYGSELGEFNEDISQNPAYQFRLREGTNALMNAYAGRGGTQSGNAQRGITEYAQGLASQEYQNAFNRYYQQRANRLNNLFGIIGGGTAASSQLGSAIGQSGQNAIGAFGNQAANNQNALGAYGQGQTNALTDAANARSSSYVGVGNAINTGVQSGLNYQMQKSYLDRLGGGSTAPGASLPSPPSSAGFSAPTFGQSYGSTNYFDLLQGSNDASPNSKVRMERT